MQAIATNRRVSHDYQILDSYECGIVLTGTEIKSIRLGKVQIQDAYARVKDFELYVINMHIAKYAFGNLFNHEELRERKLLMAKHDIIKIGQKLKTDGLTLIPTKVYLKGGYCKVEVALCKGKKLYDKRESAKVADQQARVDKAVKSFVGR